MTAGNPDNDNDDGSQGKQHDEPTEPQGAEQGCISCGPCSYPELTEDHVLPSA